MTDQSKKRRGVPRTFNQAKKRGYKKAKVSAADLEAIASSKFIQLAETGSRPDAICGIAPSPNNGFVLVCYKDASRRCRWVEIPKSDVLGHN